jgi:predicted transcriptional regulator
VTAASSELIHGTRRMYRRGGCRQECCQAARRAYDQWYRAQKKAGKASMVDAAPARVHVLRLIAFGMSQAVIAKEAGVSAGAVKRLVWGGGDELPSQRIRRRNAAALLAVQADLRQVRDFARTPSQPTVRRLRALVACGWSQMRLARRLGVTRQRLNEYVRGRHDFVVAQTARRVQALFEELRHEAPPQQTSREKGSVSYALGVARRDGWTPDMADETSAVAA